MVASLAEELAAAAARWPPIRRCAPASTGTWRSCRRLSRPTRRNYYLAAPANYYAEFWHQNAINGKQHGFPDDDDNGQSPDISVTNPQYRVVAVGW
jgi:hypothetical protein